MSTYSLKRCLIKMHTDVYTQMLHFFKLFLEAFSSEVDQKVLPVQYLEANKQT